MKNTRDRLSHFTQKNLSSIYQFLFKLRDSWRVYRQKLFPYHFNKKRYPNLFISNDYKEFPNIESKVERTIWCFWTGSNEMSENRKRGYKSLIDNSGIEIKLITPQNLSDYILPDYPLHKAYNNLSLVHKSDYLRCYFMHFYGGGYQDIKPNYKNWEKAFDTISSNKDMWVLGYTELNGRGIGKGQGIIDKDLFYYYQSCVGTGGFICRSNTKFTSEWYIELNKRMDFFEEKLLEYPGDIKGRNQGYPIKLLQILSQIWAPLCLKYKNQIIHDNTVLPELENYQ